MILITGIILSMLTERFGKLLYMFTMQVHGDDRAAVLGGGDGPRGVPEAGPGPRHRARAGGASHVRRVTPDTYTSLFRSKRRHVALFYYFSIFPV